MSNYSGKTALITGASSGIGEAFARILAGRGMQVILVARNEDRLRTLAQELTQNSHVQAEVIAADLSREYAAREIASEVQARGLAVDLLVNNAGFGSYGHFTDLDPERDHAEVMVNVTSVVDLAHAFLPLMARRGSGAVINVSSMAAFSPLPYMAVYSASKSFVLAFSEALAEEYREHGVQVMALCPGPVKTNFFDALGGKDPAAAAGARVLTSEQVVEAALNALERGRSYVVPGNEIIPMIVRLYPRRTYLRVTAKSLRKMLPAGEISAPRTAR
jgi:short-subunit dehydrogenase